MSNLFFKTIERLTPILRRGDLDACERDVADEIRKLAPTPFHIVLDLSITNDPQEAANHFDGFIALQSHSFTVGAVYTEMNGFDINPGRWYCDQFAFTADGGSEEFDWISDWQSGKFESYTITGLEPLQKVYAGKAFREDKNRTASYMSSLMVVIQFQQFMITVASKMKLLQFPLYVTAHDFDFIASFDPRPSLMRPPLRKFTSEEQVSELIGRLNGANKRTRLLAVLKLGSLGSGATIAVPELIRYLDGHNVAMCQGAARALAEIDPESEVAVSALVSALMKDIPTNSRQALASALGNCPTRRSVEALSNSVFDKDPQVQYTSVIALKVLGPIAKTAEPVLRKLLQSPIAAETRLQAETALKLMSE